MAFLDKLNQVAKNIGDKTSDAIETTKLNSKINSEKAAADEDLKKIGEYYYSRFAASGEALPEVLNFCQSAKAHYQAAAAAQAEIEHIKAENEAQPAAPTPAAAPIPAAAPAASASGVTCPACGKANTPGTKFCCECGGKLEIPAAPQAKTCPQCGAAITQGLRFCGGCGARLEG